MGNRDMTGKIEEAPSTEITRLQQLFRAIAQASDEATLEQIVTTQIGDYFAAQRAALFFVETFLDVERSPNKPIPVLMRRALSLDENPVLRYLVQRHTAVHDEVVLPPGVWKTICPRADHGHVLTGPIILRGELVGGAAFTRHRQADAFSAEDLADLSALCLHLSSQLRTLRQQAQTQTIPLAAPSDTLTPREREIAALVAQGLTNKSIGQALWITENSVKQALKRMYRKLAVSSRVEMVAKLIQASSEEQRLSKKTL